MKETSNMETVLTEKNGLTYADKIALDRQSILAMAGKYKVTFDFIETFATEEDYQREGLYQNEAIEYVFPIIDEPEFISLQHILVINEKVVVKHWRQDWIFENQDLLVYHKDNVWKNIRLNEEQVKGTWTQKVFQVDDSPRYQGIGTWVYVGGKRYWESTSDAPLPRRQETRTDYNVLVRNSRIELTDYGWMMDQDNQKVYRDDNGNDKLIVWEKGFEVLTAGDYNCQPAIDYWEKTKLFWKDVREVWDEAFSEKEELSLHEKVDGKMMYEHFFALAAKYDENSKSEEIKKSLKEIIASYRR